MPADITDLDLREQIARIDRAQAETQKFHREAIKLQEEAGKLQAEGRKFERERIALVFTAGAAVMGACTVIAGLVIHLTLGR